MSTSGLTSNLKSPDRNKQFISNIPRILQFVSTNNLLIKKNGHQTCLSHQHSMFHAPVILP